MRGSLLFLLTLFLALVSWSPLVHCHRLSATETLKSHENETVNFFLNGFYEFFWGKYIENPNALQGVNVSTECQNSLQRTLRTLDEGKPWAFSFLDSSGKAIAGVLEGTVANFGDYDECLDIQVETEPQIHGKYCLLKFKNNMQCDSKYLFGDVDRDIENDPEVILNRLTRFPFAYGLCVPSSCSTQDVGAIINEYTKDTMWSLARISYCMGAPDLKLDVRKLTKTEMIAFTILGLVIALPLISTAVELLTKTPNRFSIKTNFKRLISRREEDQRRLLALDRLRVFIVYLDIALHANLVGGVISAYYLIRRLEDIPRFATTFSGVSYTSHAVNEGLFGAGAMGASIAYLKYLDKKNVLWSCLVQLFKWWLKVCIILIVLMCIQVAFPYVADGPAFNELMRDQVTVCENTWWQTFMMMDNYAKDLSSVCIPLAWSLSAEFQLQVFVVVAVVVLSYSRSLGKLLIWSVIAVSFVLPGFYVLKYNLNAWLIFPIDVRHIENEFKILFTNCLTHVTGYMAIFYMAFMHYEGFPGFRLKPRTRLYGHIIVFIFCYSPVYWHIPYNMWRWERNQLVFAIHEILKGPWFLTCIFWTLSTSQDYARIIQMQKDPNANVIQPQEKHFNYSLPMLIISRMAASVFFVHGFFTYLDHFTFRQLIELDQYNAIKNAIYAMVGSTILGLVLHLLVEAPLGALLVVFRKPSVGKSVKEMKRE